MLTLDGVDSMCLTVGSIFIYQEFNRTVFFNTSSDRVVTLTVTAGHKTIMRVVLWPKRSIRTSHTGEVRMRLGHRRPRQLRKVYVITITPVDYSNAAAY